MKYRLFKKIISVILAVTMVITGVNMESFYDFIKAEKSTLTTEVKGKEKQTKQEKEPTVVKELEDLRTADSSTYLLSNGFKRVEYYSDNIRYEKDGKYIDYNPALKKMTETEKSQLRKQMSDSENAGDYIYTNKSGDAKQYFPKSLKDTGILLEKNECVIHFVPVIQEDGKEPSENKKENDNKADKETEEKQEDKEPESIEKTNQKTEEDLQKNKSENKTEETTDAENADIEIKDTDQNEIIYEDKKGDTAYKYISNHDGIKEEIVLNKKPESNVFSFEIKAEGLKLEKTEYDRTIRFIDKKADRQVAYIDEPNIKDKTGKTSYSEVAYELEKTAEDKYELRVVADKEYLEKAQYPIVIDPTVVWFESYIPTAALSNMPYSTSINMRNTSFMEVQNKCNPVGPYVGTEKYCYIDTSGVLGGSAIAGHPQHLDDMYVEKATLRLTEYEKNGYTPYQGNLIPWTPGTVEVRHIEGEWSADTLTWNEHPEMGNKVWAEFQCTGVKYTQHYIDLTDWARAVVSGKAPNYGLALRAKEENTGDTFYSEKYNLITDEGGKSKATYVYLTIDYRDAGRYYGIDGVYAPTGNYAETSSDMSVQTVLGDISISRTYNSLNAHKQTTIGKGFDLNYGMRIEAESKYVRVIMPNSSRWNFENDGCGGYISLGNKGTLTYENNKYKLVTIDMTEYGFDTNGYLAYIRDYQGNQLNITTDSNGKVKTITDSSGTLIQFTYTGNKLTKAEEVKNGTATQEVSYTYDGEYLIKAEYPGKLETHYEYTDGRLSKISNSGENNEGKLKSLGISYYTDGSYAGMVKTVENAIGVKSTYTYDFANHTTTVNDSNTKESNIRKIRYTYNDSLAVTKEEDLNLKIENKQVSEVGYGNTSSTNIDPDRPLSSKDQYGNVTSYEYDDNGNLTKTTYPDGSTETATYDEDTNDVLTSTDRNGLLTENTYTDGLLTQVKTGGLVTATYSYYPETTYGIEGLVKQETDAHGNITEYEYDTKGNVTKTKQLIDGVSHITTNTYDDKGQLTKTVDPEGVRTEYIYNGAGAVLLTKVMDKNGQNIQYTRNIHDALGREIQIIGPAVFDPAKDNLDADIYSDKKAGKCTTYNDKGQVISESDALGNTTSYVYDADGNVEKEIKPNGTYYTSKYDKDGRKTEEKFHQSENAVPLLLKKMTYAENKNEVTTTDYIDNSLFSTTVQEYDWEGNVIREETPSGLVKTSTYTNGRLMKESTTEKNQTIEKTFTEYTYDTWGRTLSKTESFDETGTSKTKYTYDNYGNVLTESVKNNAAGGQETYAITRHEYDSQNNEIKTITSDGRYVQHYYRWDGKILRDYKGMRSPLTIQGLDNVVNTGTQDYSVIKYEYDAMGRLSKKTDPLGKSETYSYDKAGREKTHVDKNGVSHTTEYDNGDNPTKKTSGKAGESQKIIKEYTYDNMGNVATEKEGNVITTYTYDGRNNCTKEETGNIVKEYQYNNSDLVKEYTISINNVQKQKVSNTYDRYGNVTHVYENDTLKASYDYDKWGQVIKTTCGNGNIEEKTYNAAGLVTVVRNKRGTDVVSQYAYTYYYDGKEQMKTDESGTSIYLYNKAGELEKEVKYERNTDNTSMDKSVELNEGIPEYVNVENSEQIRYFCYTPVNTASYTLESYNNSGDPKVMLYDIEGNLISQNDDGGVGNNFRLTSTLNGGTAYIIGVREYSGKGCYNFKIKQGEQTNTSKSNAKTIQEEIPEYVNIDSRNQARYYTFTAKKSGTYRITASDNNGAPWLYLYTENGDWLVGGNGVFDRIEYTMTAGERYIIAATLYAGVTGHMVLKITPPENGRDNVTEYTYDGNGNRTKLSEYEDGNKKQTTYTYDKNDRLLTESIGNDIVTYTYDDNGNMLEKSEGTEQTFDLLDRMSSYKSAEGTVTTYGYYADDMRKSKKTGNNAEITQIWSDDDIALELESGEVRSTYVYGENLICSTYGWYLYNAHGDVTALTANNGTVTKNYEYNSFGVQKSATDDGDENPYRYSGEYYDAESGYTYLQARYYDPDTGRFISEDPAMDGDNWYVYCGNDPVNMVDPTGMWSGKIHEKISAYAFGKARDILKKGYTKNGLLDGCTFPDRERKSNAEYGKGKWHGHSSYAKIMEQQIFKAQKLWKKGKKCKENKARKEKYKEAYFELGKGLHTLQDFYAHNVKLNGKIVGSRKVADGVLWVTNLGSGTIFVASEHNEYLSQKFIKGCGKTIRANMGIHSITADNPNAYFDGNKWVITTEGSNPRLKKAKKESIEYLEKAAICFSDTKTKYSVKKNSKYYKKLSF